MSRQELAGMRMGVSGRMSVVKGRDGEGGA